MTVQEIHAIRDRILDHREINRTEALSLMAIDPQDTDALKALYEGANEIREKFQGPFFDLCSIMNVKSGKCSEDCRFCAQSIHFETPADSFDLVHVDAIIERAKEMEEEGVHRFSLVSSGKGIDDQDFQNLLHIYKRLSSETTLKLCASHGIIDEGKARRLKEAGVKRYHHNLETSRAFYSEICTTHGFQERIETIEACKAAGL